jgi:hypothetical protein
MQHIITPKNAKGAPASNNYHPQNHVHLDQRRPHGNADWSVMRNFALVMNFLKTL